MMFDRAAWLAEQRKKPQQFRPGKGYARNPLLKYGANEPCLCGSKLKWKKCCGPSMPIYIPVSELEDHKAVLRGEK